MIFLFICQPRILWSQPVILLGETPSSQLDKTLIDCPEDDERNGSFKKCGLNSEISSKEYHEPLLIIYHLQRIDVLTYSSYYITSTRTLPLRTYKFCH